MANTTLTATAVTREALRVLHQKLNFVGSVNRQYDSSYARSGAKIGDSLKIRLPNQYTVRTGATLSAQDTTETSVTLQVATQKGVDVNFTSAELTMALDDFSERIIDPAMSVLAANIEYDALSMYKDVYNEVSDVGANISLDDVLDGAQSLTEALTPPGPKRCLNMQPQDNRDLVDELKGLFNPHANIGKNFREGMIANQFVGFGKVYENTLMPIHTTGTDDGTGDYLVNGASQTGATLTVDTGAGTFKQGDVITVVGINRVHPETKTDTGKLQRFVVTADVGVSATSIPISPSIITSGATQNVSGSPADNAAVFKRESDGSTAVAAGADYQISLGYHQDAFAFATADLIMPRGVDFAARELLDGLSMRIVRDYDINNDKFPCRIDVLYGYKTIRPEFAVRYGMN